MKTTRVKLVTIIMEAVLEDQILDEIRELGATGYSLVEVHGEGSRGIGATDFEGRNLRLETLVSAATAGRILEHLAEKYFRHYAVVAYATDVEVIRGRKYDPDSD